MNTVEIQYTCDTGTETRTDTLSKRDAVATSPAASLTWIVVVDERMPAALRTSVTSWLTSALVAPWRQAVRQACWAALLSVSLTRMTRLISNMPSIRTDKKGSTRANSTAAAAGRAARR